MAIKMDNLACTVLFFTLLHDYSAITRCMLTGKFYCSFIKSAVFPYFGFNMY